MMGIMVATNQMRSRAPKPCLRKRITQCLDIGGVIGKAKIIVAAKRQQRFAVSNKRRLLGAGYLPARPVKPSVFAFFQFKGKVPHGQRSRLAVTLWIRFDAMKAPEGLGFSNSFKTQADSRVAS
jgi:hypothetical protein